MKTPTLNELLTRYGKMSQEEFDALDPKNFTDVACTAYTKERFRRNNIEKNHSIHEEASNNASDLSPKEIIKGLKNELGTEYEIWQEKQRIVIRKNAAIGCALRITLDENGNMSYGSPFAYYSFWFSFLISIPFVILIIMINIFLISGVLVTIPLVLFFGFIVRVFALIPSKSFIQRIELIMKS